MLTTPPHMSLISAPGMTSPMQLLTEKRCACPDGTPRLTTASTARRMDSNTLCSVGFADVRRSSICATTSQSPRSMIRW